MTIIALLGLGVVLPAHAQRTSVINTETVTNLQSVQQIDYASPPDEAGELVSGWLRVSDDGANVVTINSANDMLLWDTRTGRLRDVYAVPGADGTNANMMDVAWREDSRAVHSLHTDGGRYYVAEYSLRDGTVRVITTPTGGDNPVRVWADVDMPDYTWIEVIAADSSEMPYVMRLSLEDGSVAEQLPSAPEADTGSEVRIGRMPAPLAVTSDMSGLVQLWNLETGEEISEATVEGIPMFGHINGAAGRKLAWRDPMSLNLNLLDFDTGENIPVAELNGVYWQALLVTPDADVILGVNGDQQPVVVAWDIERDVQINLGEYRQCSRTPDMVQLSPDGTTLVIGCDTGLDIWRVASGSNS